MFKAPYDSKTGLYWLNTKIISYEPTDVNQPVLYAIKTDENWNLWHQRFAHANQNILSKLHNNVKGIPQLIRPKQIKPCQGCLQGAAKLLTHPDSDSRATGLLDLVHMDLLALPVDPLWMPGYNFVLSIMDDYSSMGQMFILKQKSQTTAAFDKFRLWAERQCRTTLKSVRTDRGGEFMGTQDDELLNFKTYCQNYGIQHQTSSPDTPQQNGRAERWQQTIMNKARSILLSSPLPNTFWWHAVKYAIHTYNRTPASRLKWKTPIELWDGKSPDVSGFHIFGCKAYVHVHKHK